MSVTLTFASDFDFCRLGEYVVATTTIQQLDAVSGLYTSGVFPHVSSKITLVALVFNPHFYHIGTYTGSLINV